MEIHGSFAFAWTQAALEDDEIRVCRHEASSRDVPQARHHPRSDSGDAIRGGRVLGIVASVCSSGAGTTASCTPTRSIARPTSTSGQALLGTDRRCRRQRHGNRRRSAMTSDPFALGPPDPHRFIWVPRRCCSRTATAAGRCRPRCCHHRDAGDQRPTGGLGDRPVSLIRRRRRTDRHRRDDRGGRAQDDTGALRALARTQRDPHRPCRAREARLRVRGDLVHAPGRAGAGRVRPIPVLRTRARAHRRPGRVPSGARTATRRHRPPERAEATARSRVGRCWDGHRLTAVPDLAVIGDFMPLGFADATGHSFAGNSLDNTIRVGKLSSTEWMLLSAHVQQIANVASATAGPNCGRRTARCSVRSARPS